MLLRTRSKTSTGTKYSVFFYDNQFDPVEVRVHCNLSTGMFTRLEQIEGIRQDIKSQLSLALRHPLMVRIYGNTPGAKGFVVFSVLPPLKVASIRFGDI